MFLAHLAAQKVLYLFLSSQIDWITIGLSRFDPEVHLPNQQYGLLGPVPLSPYASQPFLDQSLWNDGNGPDFGLPNTSLGNSVGVLGDVRTLAQTQPCINCQQGLVREDDSGESVGDGSDSGRDGGQIINAQYVIPAPGALPPPIPPQGQQPSRSLMIGDPNAWWNDDFGDLANRAISWAKGGLTEEEEEKCQDQYDTDMINCKIVWAVKGARQGKACEERAWDRLMDCRFNNKGKDIPPFWRR